MRLEDAKIIAREDHYYRRKVREALEIKKHPENLNRDGGYEISDNWRPLLQQICSSRTHFWLKSPDSPILWIEIYGTRVIFAF